MNDDILEGNWKQIKGQVKETWGRLTDDEMQQIEGHRDRLVGILQEKYGYTQQEAKDSINDFLDQFEEDLQKNI